MLKTIDDVKNHDRIKILDFPFFTGCIDGEISTVPTQSYSVTCDKSEIFNQIIYLVESNPNHILNIYPDEYGSMVHSGPLLYDPITFNTKKKLYLRYVLIDKDRLPNPKEVKIESKKINRLKYLLIK